MRKKLYIVWWITLSLALCACSKEQTQKETGEETEFQDDTSTYEEMLTSVKWMDIYNDDTLILNDDDTMSYKDNLGTWFLDGTCITLNYSGWNNQKIERYIDITEENDITVLQFRKESSSGGKVYNSNSSVKYYPEDKIDIVKSSLAKKIGDTVSTDIIELNVKKAALAYYSERPTIESATGTVINLDVAYEPAEKGGPTFLESNKGHALVCLDFTVKNTDRSTLDTQDNIISFAIRQGDDYSLARGYDLNNPDGSDDSMDLRYSIISENGGDFKYHEAINKLIDSGSTYEMKVVNVVNFEPEDLSAPFELIVTVKDSQGNEKNFIYDIEL